MKLNKKQRAQLREMFGGRCTYCGELLPEVGWHEYPVEPIYRKWTFGLDANGDYTGRTVATGE